MDWKSAIAMAAVAFVLSRIWFFAQNLKDVNYIDGIKSAFGTSDFPGFIIPTTWWNPGRMNTWVNRHKLYVGAKQELVALVPFISGAPTIFTCSAEVGRQLLMHKSGGGWEKLAISVKSLGAFGPNVFATYMDEWPRHRRIVNPSFNQKLYTQVWNESIRTYRDMSAAEGWSRHETAIVSDINAITMKFALHIVASCGFGMPLSWTDTLGERFNGMTVEECFEATSDAIIPISILPRWCMSLPIPGSPFPRMINGYNTLEALLVRMIAARRASGDVKDDQKDAFSLLLAANDVEEGEGKPALNDKELVSNVFLLMLAGHETTGRALAATLGLLACHPEVQAQVYKEIIAVVPNGQDPVITDYDSLPSVLGCLQEGLRFFPSADAIARRALHDTMITVPARDGTTVNVPIKKDIPVVIDFIGLGLNPRHYPEPHKFMPSRWASPETEQLMAFSYGPRICLGRKFALTEAVCLLTLILRDYKVEAILEDGESPEGWRTRVLEGTAHALVGFGIGAVPLKFTKRR